MAGYTKLFGSILHSTIWAESHATRIVWMTMLAAKDKDGIVEASIPGLARLANVTLEECEVALGKFLAPDPYSRTKDNDGRRIEEVHGGWRVLNHDYYRGLLDADDQRDKAAERKRRQRDREAARAQQQLAAVTPSVTPGNDESRSGVTVTPGHDGHAMSRHADPDADQIQIIAGVTARLQEPKGKKGWNVEQLAAAQRIWDFLNKARQWATKGVRELKLTKSSIDMVCKLFVDGHTEIEAQEVIRQYAREAKAKPETARWFDGVTPFRPANFQRALGKVGTASESNGATASHSNGSNGAKQQGKRTITIGGVAHEV